MFVGVTLTAGEFGLPRLPPFLACLVLAASIVTFQCSWRFAQQDFSNSRCIIALRPPMSTAYHAKYFAYELTKRCASDSMEKLAASLADAQVDLNPHQVEAAQ